MKSFDIYIPRPEEMIAYMSRHGWHFSKKACQYAVSRMRNKKGEKVKQMTYDEVDSMLKKNNVELINDNGYDKVYVLAMCMADYLGSAIEDDKHVAMFVKDFIDDPDGTDEKAFRHWYADMQTKGIDIAWEEII